MLKRAAVDICCCHCMRGEIFWKLVLPRNLPEPEQSEEPEHAKHLITPPQKQKLNIIEYNWIMNSLRNEASRRNIENEASNCAWFGVKKGKKTQWDIKHVHGTCEDLNSFQISWCVLSVSSLNDNHPLQPISLCHKTLKHLESHFKTC